MNPRVFIPELKSPPVLPAADHIVTLEGESMGTTWSVRAVVQTSLAPALAPAVSVCLETVITQMSPWRPDSVINRYNAGPPGSWTDVPAEFAAVLTCAMQVAEQSAGAFDPTLGHLVDLWGFGAAGPVHEPPGADVVRAAREASGWSRLALEAGAVFQPGGLRLDFSGIAKGYAVDLVAARLKAMGVESALVEIGGELVGFGIKPDGHPWWVDLEAPPGSPFDSCRVALCGGAIATSGDYRRGLESDGRRYSHTLDPLSGDPVTHGLASVTVLADSAMAADAQATAITVMGPDAGYDYAAQHGLAALLVDRREDQWRERMTPDLAAMLA